jgi:hypothetical protein
MKKHLRFVALGAGLLSLVWCVGCGGQSVNADEVPAKSEAPSPQLAAADEPKPAEQKPADAQPAEKSPSSAPVAGDGGADSKATNAPLAQAGANQAQQVVAPAQLKLTPALADVIRMVQAGVGEDVLMTYITNSTDVFNMGSDEILYLHDLGVPTSVITTLIQRDSTPEALARKQAANAVQPLPPGVALTAPATNVYPTKAAALPAAPAPVATETAAVPAEPSTETNPTPAVVYTVPTVVEQPANVSYFYTELAPYGTWIDYPGYGRCWRPTIAVWNSSWRPYADGGRWLWTDCGWYWYSDYSWGAHAFHYGRWTCPPGIGWLWVPDVHWGPAWVSWRYSRSHCGWAPLPPSARWVAGHGFYHNTLSVGVSFEFGLSDHHYVFLPFNRFCDRRPSHYYLAAHHARSVHRESTVFNNYVAANHRPVVNNGVGFERIASATRGSIRQISVRSSDAETARGTRREQLNNDGTTLTIARPTVTPSGITPATKPISSLSTVRSGHTRRTAVTEGSASTVNGTASRSGTSLAQPETPSVAGPVRNANSSASARPPIIIRGNSRATGNATPASTATESAKDQPAIVNRSGSPSSGNSGGVPTRRTTSPGGGRATPPTVEPTRQPTPSATVKSAPAPVTVPQQPARVATRSEPVRNIPQPTVQRPPVVNAPVTVQPRIAPSPAPGPAPMPRATMGPFPSSARVESYRAPSPAPSVSRPTPAQSSGGGSRSSRSSSDDGRRGSR